jgi:hypothetical protein
MTGKQDQFTRRIVPGKEPRKQACSMSLSKPWKQDDYSAKIEYDAMRSLFDRCWACGARSKPQGYYGPWLIERAHIANKPRREDRRLVVMLCTICHKWSHGERVATFPRPKLDAGHLVTLKAERDPEWFDLEFINRHSVRILEAEPVQPWYEQERGKSW